MAVYSLPTWTLRWREVVALLGAAAFIGVGLVALTYTHARMAREIEQARAREAELRERALRAQLSALQAQINPHFLFNALNALAELTHEDPHVAERLVGDLAYLLRYSLRSSALGTVPLSQELEAVERYLRVERARFGERLRVETRVDPSVLDTLVPGLVLQPLVENAVVHGVAPRAAGGALRVEVSRADGGVLIAVEDDGPGVASDVRRRLASVEAGSGPPRAGGEVGTGGAGGGLANVQQRVALAYRGRARFAVTGGARGGARVELWLPSGG
jgi:two-component system LytT family sensor kinase